ncbi:MAG: polyprenyl diphosphate synthase [Patescibacteria group bacterium]|nr:polyprenyl diphosphate synthase [Patescibacteria group bacterium]
MAGNDLPQHIAFVLDGNRRWARAQGLPTLEGHMRGMENIENIAQWCIEKDIKYLTMYAFSTENWDRSPEELDYLFNKVFVTGFRTYMERLAKENVKINIFGEIERFPEKMRAAIKQMVADSQNNTGLNMNFCLDYGGRAEIIRAVKNIVQEGIVPEKIDEAVIANHLYSAGMPDPDLMIRTGGEHRLSGFLLWQMSYTEFYFPQICLPGFTKQDFEEALEWYASRDRRHGK